MALAVEFNRAIRADDEWFDEPDDLLALGIDVDGEDDGAVLFVDDAVDAGLAVGAEDLVFADGEPGVAIDLAGGEGGDAVGVLVEARPGEGEVGAAELRRLGRDAGERSTTNFPLCCAGRVSYRLFPNGS